MRALVTSNWPTPRREPNRAAYRAQFRLQGTCERSSAANVRVSFSTLRAPPAAYRANRSHQRGANFVPSDCSLRSANARLREGEGKQLPVVLGKPRFGQIKRRELLELFERLERAPVKLIVAQVEPA